jgi:hypothetical protein
MPTKDDTAPAVFPPAVLGERRSGRFDRRGAGRHSRRGNLACQAEKQAHPPRLQAGCAAFHADDYDPLL